MGITVEEMLKTNFFRNFELIAGAGGLNKEIQGIATMDAPDGYNWTKGRELVITSGYIFKDDPDMLIEYARVNNFDRISGLAIKFGRYIDEPSEELIQACNEKNIPLMGIPMEIPWMTIMNELNVIVMNKTIKQFRIADINESSLSEVPYQELKINKILSQIEKEMDFPSMIYDLSEEKAYYSSENFSKLSYESIEVEDYWNPSFEYSYEVLCDNLQIIRYRFRDDSKYERPYSWITIPIKVGGRLEAYFVILEEEGLIDYFDQFILRIGFILIESSYEQILLAKKYQNKGFRKLAYDLMESRLPNDIVVRERAQDIGLDIDANYYLLLFEDRNDSIRLRDIEKDIEQSYLNTLSVLGGKFALLDEKYGLVMIKKDETGYEDTLKLTEIKAMDMKNRMETIYEDMDIKYAVTDISFTIFDFKEGYERALKSIEMGARIYSERNFVKYSDLGVFAWMDVNESELGLIAEDIKPLFHQKNKELLKTLKVYLESNLNYSLTAKKLYIHINTVRKRIDEIEEITNIDLEDPMKRVKLEVLLKLI